MTPAQPPSPHGRLVYDELDTLAQMRADAGTVDAHLPLARSLADAARAAVGPAPSLHYDEFPREVAKRDIRVDEAAARLARHLGLG